MLTVSNSAHSHKTSLITSLASPFFTVVGFSAGQAFDRAMEPMVIEAGEDLPPEFHEHGKPKVMRKEDFEKIGD